MFLEAIIPRSYSSGDDNYTSNKLNVAYVFRINEIVNEWQSRLLDMSWFM